MLITKVKVGQVTNLSEARYCAGMGVDYLSFPISTVDPKTYQEITGWVAGPSFGIEVTKENVEMISQYSSEFIQVDIELLHLVPNDKNLIVRVNDVNWTKVREEVLRAKNRILFLELFASHEGTENEFVIKDASQDFQVLVRLSSARQIDTILKLPIAGISLEGSNESKVGLKEYPLAEVLEKLEEN